MAKTFYDHRLIDLATSTGSLSPAQIRLVGSTLDKIDADNARKAALEAILGILDAGQGLSAWKLATRLESRLRRFEAVSRRRIESGARPATDEELCLAILSGGPVCARKLWTEIRALGV